MKFILAFIVLLYGNAAWASEQSGKVTYVAQTGSRFLFGLTGSRGTRPGCDCCGRWEIVVNSVESQSKVATIMTAFSTQKPTSISGTGACAGGANDTEEVNYLQVNNQ